MPTPDPPERPPLDPTRVSPRLPDRDPGPADGSPELYDLTGERTPRIPGLEPVTGLTGDTSGHEHREGTVKSGRGAAAGAGRADGGTGPVPGRIGKFEIRAVLGEGAFGRVYRGYDTDLTRDVAIKVPHAHAMTPGFRERFLREARAAAAIHHPNVCPIYEVGTDAGVPYLVSHFVPGPTLAALLERRERRGGPFPVKQAAVVVRKLALGVAAAHDRGVVHRDLKPANVLVDEVRREVLITDFGVAKVAPREGDAGRADDPERTRDGAVVGTAAYMSPEQAMGQTDRVGPAADVYSLGVILYRLLAGRLPYEGGYFEVLAQVWEGKPPPPRALRPGLDGRLNDLCLKAMAKDPGDRFASARALAAALEAYLRNRSPEESGELPVLTTTAGARPVPALADDAGDAADAVEAELAFDLPATARPMLTLMQAVAGALAADGQGGLARRLADPGFPPRLAAEAVRRCRAASPGGLAHMLGVTAASTIADAQVAAAQAAWEAGAELSEADRLTLELYLGQLPDAARKAFKRADDPAGVTVPPDFRAESPAALAGLLPRRVPRFRGGQPLPGRPDWTLVRWLGGGGFGEVWLAQHRRVENLFGAVKFGLDLSAAQRQQLARDAAAADRALADRPHPGLVPLLDTRLDGDAPWLMYEYVGGGDLADLVPTWGQLPAGGRVRAALERLREVADAVAALHRARVVHRDLRPANILRDAGTFRLRVTDAGAGGVSVMGQVARRAGGAAPEPRGAHALLYASPQQLRGDPADPRDDVHALGVLAFQMLTGRLTAAVPADYDRALQAAGAPPEVARLVGACASPDPAARPRDAHALLDQLDAAVRAPRPVPGAKVVASAFVLEVDGGRTDRTETLVCPVCRARLQVAAGRTTPVPCPKCSTRFAPAAGRAALKVRPLARPVAEPLDLDEAEELPPPPRAKPGRPPADARPTRRRDDEPPPRRRRRSFVRTLKWCFWLGLLGAAATAGVVYRDPIAAWVETRQAKPVEFEPVRAFEPGADTARVYGFLPGSADRLLTNADRKDVFAAVWNVTTGRRECVLKVGGAGDAVDPRVTQFRLHADPGRAARVAVFNRDPQGLAPGGVWVYTLPDPDDAPAKDGDAPAASAAELGPRRRAWDVSRDLTRAVGPPGGGKVLLWDVAAGTAVKELAVEGTTFRAVGFSPDGRHVVGLCDESRVRVWEADTGALDPGRTARLATRPAWEGAETGVLAFDPAFTRVAVTTEGKTGAWDLKTGAVVAPMKKAADGVLLRPKYRLRIEAAGPGTFSLFHDEFTLRARKLGVGGDGAVTAWCVSDDAEVLAAASNRTVQVWRLRYPPDAPAPGDKRAADEPKKDAGPPDGDPKEDDDAKKDDTKKGFSEGGKKGGKY